MEELCCRAFKNIVSQRVVVLVKAGRARVRLSVADFSDCWKSEAKAAHPSYCGFRGGRWDVERLVVDSGAVPRPSKRLS